MKPKTTGLVLYILLASAILAGAAALIVTMPEPLMGILLGVKRTEVDLYDFEIDLPSKWTLTKIVTGMDQASYTVQSPDQTITLFIIPFHGSGEWRPQVCPAETVAIKALGNDSSLVRFFDRIKNRYVYTGAGISDLTLDGSGEIRPEGVCMFPPVVMLGENFGAVEMQYWGQPAGLDKALRIADHLVKSISGRKP